MFLIRGIVFSHEAVRDWEAKLTPALAESLRRRRRGKAGRSYYVDDDVHQGPWALALPLSCHRSAGRFCRAYDQLRNFLRSRSRTNQKVSADYRGFHFPRRAATVLSVLEPA